MASCVKNVRTKNYQNLVICFQVTVKNVRDVFEIQCIEILTPHTKCCIAVHDVRNDEIGYIFRSVDFCQVYFSNKYLTNLIQFCCVHVIL